MRTAWFVGLVAAGLLGGGPSGVGGGIGLAAAQEAAEERVELGASYDTAKKYPSLTPRSYVKVAYDNLEVGLPGEPPIYRLGNLAAPGAWIIRRLGDEPRDLVPERVDLITAAGLAYLYLVPGTVRTGDTIDVGIRAEKRRSDGSYRPVAVMHLTPIPVTTIDPYTLVIDPGFTPDQELRDGTKKTVGNLTLVLDVPSLLPNDFARIYLRSDNRLSTDSEDITTKLELRLGAERSLTSRWYVPALVEAEFVGNQDFSQATFLLSAGARTILPWRWTRWILFNSVVRAPISPVLEVASQYVHLLETDPALTPPDAQRDTFRVQGQLGWAPIFLLPGLFGDRSPSAEIMAKGWWFADDRATSSSRGSQWAGRVEVSLLVPLTAVKGLEPVLRAAAGGINGRIRLKYSDGANEANGFKTSSEFTVSMEVIQ
jgi:hypothetical protein